MSEFQVFSRELFKMPERTPAPNGCLDPRLGISDKSAVCETCRCGGVAVGSWVFTNWLSAVAGLPTLVISRATVYPSPPPLAVLFVRLLIQSPLGLFSSSSVLFGNGRTSPSHGMNGHGARFSHGHAAFLLYSCHKCAERYLFLERIASFVKE